MITPLPTLDELPRQNASQVKNKWGEVVRQVREAGSVAITSHATVEMVLLDAAAYRDLAARVESLNARLQAHEQAALYDLSGRFEARLAALQTPSAGGKARSLFETKGKLPKTARRPKAGSAY
jgi:prevent-host-death family protein